MGQDVRLAQKAFCPARPTKPRSHTPRVTGRHTLVKAESEAQALEFATQEESNLTWKDDGGLEYTDSEISQVDDTEGDNWSGIAPSEEEIAHAITAK